MITSAAARSPLREDAHGDPRRLAGLRAGGGVRRRPALVPALTRNNPQTEKCPDRAGHAVGACVDHRERNRTMDHPTPSPRQSPLPCPLWCSPIAHFEDADEVLHASASTVLMVGDERWEFDLLQHVEYRHPDEPDTVDLRIQIVDTVFSGCDAEHLFEVAAIPALAAQLMTEYHRARFLGALAPVEPLVTGDAA